jgi:hypothetical protein
MHIGLKVHFRFVLVCKQEKVYIDLMESLIASFPLGGNSILSHWMSCN